MRVLIALALPVLAACASPAPRDEPAGATPPASGAPAAQPAAPSPTPNAGAGQVTLDFRPGTGKAGGDQNATAQGAAGSMELSGTMSTPNPCYKLTGELAGQNTRELRIRVVGRPDPDMMCIQAIGSVPYTATVRGMQPGTYSLTIVHTYPESGWDEATVLQTQVQVR
ncbi:MAG TPA: hypothetical protein VF665_00330 [Longimicrobium sp.]|jgi:hypothetical protein|uniref:hypothetical protein n=1 Tax=Longimicrobium sp. TaxID=2029185 RepID=UPI002ED7B8B4